MASAMVRRSIWALAAAVFALVAIAASIPYIASTQILRDRIALELSAWTGYRVTLGSAPEIDLWPVFRTTLSNVRMSSWSGDASNPVVDAEIVEADLSALAALRGDIVFTNVRFVRPTVRLSRADGHLQLQQSPQAGRIAGAVSLARNVVAADPAKPDRSKLPDTAMGTVSFRDARVVIETGKGEREFMSAITGKLSWASLDRAASLSATGIWHGESVAVEASSEQPLMLLAGGQAPVDLSLKSAPANLSFNGTLNLSPESFIDGTASFSTPSLKRMLEWSQAEISTGAAIGALSVDSHVNGTAQRMKFENAKLTLDGNPGNGTVEVALPGGGATPSVAGTLAFDKIDLRSFLAAFASLGIHTGPKGAGIDPGVPDQVNLDLRLSAQNATAGSVALSSVAATAQVKQGLAAFDISEAKVFGGTVQIGLRMDRGHGNNSVEVRVLGENIRFGRLRHRHGPEAAGAGGARRRLGDPQGRRRRLARRDGHGGRFDHGKFRPRLAAGHQPARLHQARRTGRFLRALRCCRRCAAVQVARPEGADRKRRRPYRESRHRDGRPDRLAGRHRAVARPRPCAFGHGEAGRRGRRRQAGGGVLRRRLVGDAVRVADPAELLRPLVFSQTPAIKPPSPRRAACSSRWRCASRRLLTIEAMTTPVVTMPIRIVHTALISGVTPSLTWL